MNKIKTWQELVSKAGLRWSEVKDSQTYIEVAFVGITQMHAQELMTRHLMHLPQTGLVYEAYGMSDLTRSKILGCTRAGIMVDRMTLTNTQYQGFVQSIMSTKHRLYEVGIYPSVGALLVNGEGEPFTAIVPDPTA